MKNINETCKKMKIALIGNTNNNFSVLARYLRDAGYDVELLLFNTSTEWNPYSDTYQPFTVPIKTLSWGSFPQGLLLTKKETIRKELRDYNFLIGTYVAAAYCAKANIDLDIYLPTGGEILTWSNLSGLLKRGSGLKRKLYYTLFYYFHRKGLKDCHSLFIPYVNEAFEKHMLRLKLEYKRKSISCPLVYLPDVEKDDETVIKNNPLLKILNHNRHVHSKTFDGDYKGTDKVLMALAQLKHQHNIKFEYHTMRYGAEVSKTEQLARSLDIEDCIVWHDKMQRKDIYKLIRQMDLCLGQFGYSSMSSGALYEILAIGKPLIHYREDSEYTNTYDSLFYMLNAYSAEEIRDQILYFIRNSDEVKIRALENREWLKVNINDKYCSGYIAEIESAKAKMNLSTIK